MAKILITSIGNGAWNQNSHRYEYRKATYCSGTEEIESPYIFDALTRLHGYDALILVGTAGSNWGLLYEFLCDQYDLTPDLDYVAQLDELNRAPDRMHLDVGSVRDGLGTLREAVGAHCVDIVVLKYGMNDAEHIANFELLAQIGAHIQDGDSLTFDITHAFRSLAMYELLAISYIKETLGKQVTLDFVTYGMQEIARENGGKTPIVDLSVLMRLTDWLKAAEEYNRYGTTALLADLMAQENLGIHVTKEEQKVLRRLGGDAISVNDLPEFKNLVKNCLRVTQNADNAGGNIVLKYIFSDIVKRFGGILADDMLLQAELAKWHFEKKRYIAAAITLVEAILAYCGRITKIDKEVIRPALPYTRSANSDVGNFRERYNTIRRLRNKLAHAEPLSKEELDKLWMYVKSFYSTYKNRFKEIPENEQALRDALRETLHGAAKKRAMPAEDDIDG